MWGTCCKYGVCESDCIVLLITSNSQFTSLGSVYVSRTPNISWPTDNPSSSKVGAFGGCWADDSFKFTVSFANRYSSQVVAKPFHPNDKNDPNILKLTLIKRVQFVWNIGKSTMLCQFLGLSRCLARNALVLICRKYTVCCVHTKATILIYAVLLLSHYMQTPGYLRTWIVGVSTAALDQFVCYLCPIRTSKRCVYGSTRAPIFARGGSRYSLLGG